MEETETFQRLIYRRRCIIPADGFFDWKQGNKEKPMRITMKNEALFSFAGLYDIWQDAKGNKISACSIITTESNSLMQNIHDRMPVILRPEKEQTWLDLTNQDIGHFQVLLKPYATEEMTAYRVSTYVNNSKNKDKQCITEAIWLQCECNEP